MISGLVSTTAGESPCFDTEYLLRPGWDPWPPLASTCCLQAAGAFLSVSAVRGTHSGPQDTCEMMEEATHSGKKFL